MEWCIYIMYVVYIICLNFLQHGHFLFECPMAAFHHFCPSNPPAAHFARKLRGKRVRAGWFLSPNWYVHHTFNLLGGPDTINFLQHGHFLFECPMAAFHHFCPFNEIGRSPFGLGLHLQSFAEPFSERPAVICPGG